MYSQKNSKEERSESKKEKIISIIYLLEPTPLLHGKLAGWGCFVASVIGAIISAWVWAFRADLNRDRPCCRVWGHLR